MRLSVTVSFQVGRRLIRLKDDRLSMLLFFCIASSALHCALLIFSCIFPMVARLFAAERLARAHSKGFEGRRPAFLFRGARNREMLATVVSAAS